MNFPRCFVRKSAKNNTASSIKKEKPLAAAKSLPHKTLNCKIPYGGSSNSESLCSPTLKNPIINSESILSFNTSVKSSICSPNGNNKLAQNEVESYKFQGFRSPSIYENQASKLTPSEISSSIIELENRASQYEIHQRSARESVHTDFELPDYSFTINKIPVSPPLRNKPLEIIGDYESVQEWDYGNAGADFEEGVPRRNIFDKKIYKKIMNEEEFDRDILETKVISPLEGKPIQLSFKKENQRKIANKENSFNGIENEGRRKEPDPTRCLKTNNDLQLEKKNIDFTKKQINKNKAEIDLNSKKKDYTKEVLDSVKDFSDNFFYNTKKFINTQLNGFTDRTQCCCSARLKKFETCERALKWLLYKYKERDIPYLKQIYERLQSVEPDEACVNQIKKDIPRTFPSYRFFREGSAGVMALERILVTFSKYDPQLGYVQGINYIAADLLYHCEEFIAFWLLVMLFEIFEMRDIYLPNLPGLSKHTQIIDFLVLNHNPALYNHLCENDVSVDMFCSPWIFSLFGLMLPLEEIGFFYDQLLDHGWSFFYKFILNYLSYYSPSLMKEESDIGILTILKSRDYHAVRANSSNRVPEINWREFIKSCLAIEIDKTFISKMLRNFDLDQLRFIIKL